MSAPYRVILAEDEAPARKRMARLLQAFDQVELVAEAENGLDALNLIVEHKPDIVFLDIEMPGMNGLEVAENLPDEVAPHIIFATAYNEHALKAFELNALDYLTKPINEERLQQTFARLEANKDEAPKSSASMREGASKVANELSAHTLQKIPIPTADRYKLLDYKEVVSVEVEERTTFVHTLNKSYPLNMTLESVEKKLPGDEFLRVSRSAIINIHAIKEVVLWFGNRFKVILNNDREVITSRERSKQLKHLLKF